MFLAHDTKRNCFVFTITDPREDGYEGEVVEDVTLEEEENLNVWPDGSDRPTSVLAHARDNPRRFKRFKSDDRAKAAGFEPYTYAPMMAYHRWADHLRDSKD
jgi:hypothetical protein